MRRIIAILLAVCTVGGLTVCAQPAGGKTTSVAETVIGGATYSSQTDIGAEKKNGAAVLQAGGSVTYEFTVPGAGEYLPQFVYRALPGTGNDAELGLMIDGAYPGEDFRSFRLKRLWKNVSDTFASDAHGNEYPPEQTESFDLQNGLVWDSDGFRNQPLTARLSAGKHSLTVFCHAESLELHSITLREYSTPASYAEVERQYRENGIPLYSGDEIVIEGEAAISKSKKSLVPAATRADVSVLPSDPYHKKINYIGGSNWSQVGDTITWSVEVPESALYRVGFHFHQTYLQEGASYRSLRVDGELPFAEAQSVAFGYHSGWQFSSLSAGEDDMLLYLTAGRHELSLTVTLGELAGLAEKIQETVLAIGTVYRQIVMITGETPDPNRDYNLFSYIPDLEENLTGISRDLKSYASESEQIYGQQGGSLAQIMRKVALTVDKMLEVKFKAQTRKGALYDNYVSLSSWLYEMQSMALDLDCIVLAAPERDFSRARGSFLASFLFSAKRLLHSFAEDYSVERKNEDTLTIWTSLGRDQINMLNSLIDGDFKPKQGIDVDIKITTASLIQANLSGTAPDLELALARTAPVDYGMRGMLYDLSVFPDFDEITSRFSKNAITPYRYHGGVYGLPVTQAFPMMFVRTDIFDELSLKVPQTWEELLLVAKILSLNNMEVGLPNSVTALSMFTVQNGASFYTDDLQGTTFRTAKMQEIVTNWTDYFSKYNFPKTYSFFNRFRTGIMPLAIQNYTEYATVAAGAPEISGRWRMVSVPGTTAEDGAVNRNVCGSGTAAVILNTAKKPENAWTFLKWWTSDEIQYRYSAGLESVLGVSARVATANMAAMTQLGWDSETIRVLNEQWNSVEEMPVVPGGYYVDRVIDQLYYNIVNGNQNVKRMLNQWGEEVDSEIARKIREYAE